MNFDPSINQILQQGTVIPAHPLVLDENRTLDEARQRLLTRYYIAAGVGGLAVGVHTTQFEIRKPEFNLLEPILRITAEEIDQSATTGRFIKVAGIVGPKEQAVREARLAREYGYHLGLVSMGGLQQYSETELIERAIAIAEVIPIFGFYLQPAVGGRFLSYEFWRALADIPNLFAIKIAAFNRYQTIDVVRAVCASDRHREIALYTGNDDNIVNDLLTTYAFNIQGRTIEKKFVGGLLGHWAVWTRSAVELLERIKYTNKTDGEAINNLLMEGIQITDMNAAIFDVVNSFHGCIPGIHEVLRNQGILKGTWCLNPDEQLSPGQKEEIVRVCADYPQRTDDSFVRTFLLQNSIQTFA
jgi:dihydrodipicolinate synthase/N-acetylneuraminate lyase